MRAARCWMVSEMLLLTLGVPALLLWVVPPRMLLLVLWLVALYCHGMGRFLAFQRRLDATPSEFPAMGWGRAEADRAAWRAVLRRFMVSALVLTLATALLAPQLLGSFVRTHPTIWAAVMLLYPLLSVIPQEWIFRPYFFYRFAPLFADPKILWALNALAFGAAHLMFRNWVAPALCVVGGYFFAQTYARTRSLWLVCWEHALYGCFVFTLGLGEYFYHGAVGR